MRKSLTLSVAALTLAAGLTGCSGGTTTTTPAAPAAKAPAAAPAKTAAPHVTTWGDKVSWSSGVSVVVKYVGTMNASQYAAGAKNGRVSVFTISVTNGGTDPLNGVFLGSPKVTYGADGSAAESVVDIDQGIGSTSISTVNPGETQTVKVGYSIPAAGASAVRVEVMAPDFTSSPAVFKGAVKP